MLNDLNTRIKVLEENEQNKILELLLREKTYLAHKEKLSIRYTEIETLHKNIIWVYNANLFNKQWHKTQSTNTEKRLLILITLTLSTKNVII